MRAASWKTAMILSAAGTLCAMTAAEAAGDTDTLLLAVSADLPPYNYEEGDDVAGIDIEIAKLIAAELGRELEIHIVEPEEVLAMAQNGEVDIAMGGITQPEVPESESEFTMSESMTEQESVTVLEESTEMMETTVTYSDVYLDVAGQTLVSEHLAQAESESITGDETESEELTGIEPETEEQLSDFVIAVNPKETELLTQINEALATMRESGEIDRIIEMVTGTAQEEE